MIKLLDFTTLSPELCEMILSWRNDPAVSSFMFGGNIDIKTHFDFIKSLKNDKTKKYFLALDDEKNEYLGVIDFTNINQNDCEFGIYVPPKKIGGG